MGRYLLDSHVFLWAKRASSNLRGAARVEIEKAENTLFVSVAGLWELADKASKGKLPEFAAIADLGPAGLETALRESGFRLLPIAFSHIALARRLPFHHRDPFDRMMIAQAMAEDLIVITADRVFGRYAGLRVLAA
mgnify:CR=1 FL=1